MQSGTVIGVEECLYKRVIQGYCIYKLSDGLPAVLCHLAGSKPWILFFIHPSVISLTPVMDFSICIGSDIVDWNITSDTTLQCWESGRTIFFHQFDKFRNKPALLMTLSVILMWLIWFKASWHGLGDKAQTFFFFFPYWSLISNMNLKNLHKA